MSEDCAKWRAVREAYAISSSGQRQAGDDDSDNGEKFKTAPLLCRNHLVDYPNLGAIRRGISVAEYIADGVKKFSSGIQEPEDAGRPPTRRSDHLKYDG